MQSVMIIEHKSSRRDELVKAYESQGYTAWSCSTADIAITVFQTLHPDVIVFDAEETNTQLLERVDAWRDATWQDARKAA